MCGIAGYINTKPKNGNDLLAKMADSMRYTAEDSIDKWHDSYFAISRVHHGVTNPEPQPIFNEDKSLFIVMEGEVFDYEERKSKLIRKGHIFKYENNDAEYCLHLYEDMGQSAVKELNGSLQR